MSQIQHAQAVEAAKEHRSLCHYDYCRTKSVAAECRMARHILAAPGPSRDTATAEKCRDIVDLIILRYQEWLRDDEHDKRTAAQLRTCLTAELLAMFAGGTGDGRTKSDRIFAASDLLSRLDEIAEAYHEGEYRLPIADDATRKKMLDAIEEAIRTAPTEPAK